MKFARMLLIFALAGLVAMDAVSAQKDDKEVDAADEEEAEEEDDDFFVDVEIDATPAPGGDDAEDDGEDAFDENDNAAVGPDGGDPVAPPVEEEEGMNPMDCVGAPVDADCTECLEAGCVLTVGECISGCEFIADASCWDASSVGLLNNTIEEICDMATAETEDNEICGGEDLTDCETCTSTVKSDGEAACSWYVDGEISYCGTGGCGMIGVCPVETCDAVEEVDTPVVEDPPAVVDPPAEVSPPDEESTPCQQFPECEPCLNNRMGPGCVWIGDSCQDSCDAIMDAACYSAAIFPNTTGPEICAMAAEPVEGPTDGGVPEEGESDVIEPCTGFSVCEPCLNSNLDCAWIADSCQPNCGIRADDSCFSSSQYPNMAGPEICALAGPAETSTADMATDAPTEAEADGDRSTTTDEAISAAVSGRFVGAAVAALSALAMVMA